DVWRQQAGPASGSHRAPRPFTDAQTSDLGNQADAGRTRSALVVERGNLPRSPVSRSCDPGGYLENIDDRLAHSTPASRHIDLDDLEFEHPAGDLNVDLLADFLADESLADRAREEDLVLVVIFFARTDQNKIFFLIDRKVQHTHS